MLTKILFYKNLIQNATILINVEISYLYNNILKIQAIYQ